MNQITTTTSTTTATATSTAQSNALKILGFGAAGAIEKDEELLSEEDGRLSLEVAERMLKWHAEAVGRCVELNSTSEV